jgi:predicted transcriptional regulator
MSQERDGIVKRNSLDICADMLRVSRVGAKKSHLVYRANLNFLIVKKYLNRLVDNGLLDHSGDEFYITHKGSEFLERYDTAIAPLSRRL